MNIRLLILLILFSLGGLVACKEDKTAEAEITEPVEAKPVPVASQKFTADTVASIIHWAGSKPTGRHTGTLKLKQGEIFAKNGIVETGKFTINMNSITVTDPKGGKQKQDLENHLKGVGKDGNEDHFFNTKKFPEGTFEITAITAGDLTSTVEGNLTLKGITKNVKFPASITVSDTLIVLKSESFKIDRTLWGIIFNSKNAVENLGDQYINNDIELEVFVSAKK